MTVWPHFINAFDASQQPLSLRRHLTGVDGAVPALCHTLIKYGLIPLVGHDLRRIPPIMQRHPRQPRISEISDPALNPSANPQNTAVIVLERKGVDIGCAAVRLKWIEGALKTAYETQSLMFDDPKLISAPPTGQEWICEAGPAKHQIRSCDVVISNALCLHEDEPGLKFPDEVLRALMRLLHLWAFCAWHWSWIFAHAKDPIARKHVIDTDGFDGMTGGIARIERGIATNYRFMYSDRISFGRIIRHPEFGNLERPLGMIGHAAPVAERRTGQTFGGCTI